MTWDTDLAAHLDAMRLDERAKDLSRRTIYPEHEAIRLVQAALRLDLSNDQLVQLDAFCPGWLFNVLPELEQLREAGLLSFSDRGSQVGGPGCDDS